MNSFSTADRINTQELESIAGTSRVCRWQDTEPFLHDRIDKAVAPGTKIDCIVYPNTQSELAAVIACASRNRWGILPFGNASKLDWGGLVKLDPPNPPYQGGAFRCFRTPQPPLPRGGFQMFQNPP